MKVLLVEPNADPRAIEIDGSLASMQSLVGGLIEAIYPFSDPIALICNDEGKLTGLPQNRPLKHPETGEIYDIVCGPFFLCSAPPDSENFESLPDDLIEKYSKVFALPKFVCTSCGNNFYREQLSPFDGELLCPACLSSQTVYCSCCDRRIWTDDNVGTDAQPLCQDCFDDHFERCTTCNALIRRGDTYYRGDTPYCAECYQSVGCGDEIMSYYFKPTPIFYGEGKRFFGVELEIDGAGEDNDNAAEILHIANVERPLVYCKHDGSLDDGFEIVTHPMTLDFHLHNMPWEQIVEEAKKLGYTSHQAGTCGLHVHVNRNAFGETEVQQDAVIARILYFVEKNWEELLKFSRRTQSQLDQWAARYGYKDQPKELLDHAKKSAHAGRYTSVNLTNKNTIEFRIFRGTLKHNTLIATLQLLDRICDVALFMSDEQVKAMSWTTFVSGCTQPELVQYLKERRLYVNEPVESEADI